MTHSIPWRWRLTLVVVLTVVSAGAAWFTTPGPASSNRRSPSDGDPDGTVQRAPEPRSGGSELKRPRGGPLTLALVGDVAVSVPLDPDAGDLRGVATILEQASLAVANFELAMAATPEALPAAVTGPPAWPRAVPTAARMLRALGVGAVSLANNHVLDAGADGLDVLQARLDEVGIAHSGAGRNLETAQRPAVVDTTEGRVAVVSVTLSFAPGTRAFPSQGDIAGRPGVNGLRYSRRLTVDDAAFAGLAAAFPPALLRRNPDGRSWDLHGLTVERGSVGGMRLVADRGDLEALAASVRHARAATDVVVVSLHAHEPGNRVDEVPEIVREVAHLAVDSGADVVHGHGPHRLRGIEVYRGRPIFYSLGNFVFPDRDLSPRAADVFEDHATNVLSPVASADPPVVDFSEDVWRQSAIALVRMEHGAVSRVELHPIDLGVGVGVGVGEDMRTRGLPRVAPPTIGSTILERLQRLSAALGATVSVNSGIGVVGR
jgi:poly-gamma-glutamate capsule biosynthesis protein CapA/YwtB (metallophosphatase superfamily)